jgi:hypothetical protein
MQCLLDNRKALGESGWCVMQTISGHGTAVPVAAALNAGRGSAAVAVPDDVPDAVVLLLLDREVLLAAANIETMMFEHANEQATLKALELKLDQVS